MLSYLTVLTDDEIRKKREQESKVNECSKQSTAHKPRVLALSKDKNVEPSVLITLRACSITQWNKIKLSFPEEDTGILEYNKTLKSIWCKACAAPVRDDYCLVHIYTQKHVQNRLVCKQNKLFQTRIELAMANSKIISNNISKETHFFRIDLTRTLMMGGISQNKVNFLRPFLERHTNIPLTDRSHLIRTYLPIIMEEEMNTILEEIHDRPIRVSFDETLITYVCFCVVIGFVNSVGIMLEFCLC